MIAAYVICLSLAGTALICTSALRARTQGFAPGPVAGLLALAWLAGLAGARLLWVAEHPAIPWSLLWSPAPGGFASYGGVVGGCLAALAAARWMRFDIPWLFDLAVPGLCLFGAIARVGCFLAGCCYGTHTDLPWAIDGAHPVPLYEAAFLMVLVTVTRRVASPIPGERFLWLLLLYPAGRILLEFLRADANRVLPVLTVPQAASIVLASLACFALWRQRRLA
ncbi:MAG: prolipoprotein diacylglyceryl transferase family protein [Bryobacteraceae bacterium]